MNEYGLDDKYFKKELKSIICDVKHYTPDEMVEALKHLLSEAESQKENKDKVLARISIDNKRKRWEQVHRNKQ